MTVSLAIYALVTSGVLALGATVAHALVRAPTPGTRFIWAAALASSLAIVAFAPSRTRPPLESPQAALALNDARSSVDAPAPGGSLGLPASVASRLAVALPDWTGRLFGSLWVAAATILLGLLAVQYRSHHRRAARAPTRLVDGTVVRVTDSLGPAVVGVWPGEIVVPRWLLERPADDQALVVRHERSHVLAGDPALLLAGCIAAALMPWNPAAWYMLARLRLAIEVDCDHRVLRAGTPPRAYGALLIDLTQATTVTRAGAPAFACRTSHLERRIVAMTARPSSHRLVRRLAAGGVGALAFLAACQADLPTSAEVEAMDASAVEEIMIPRLGIDPASITYVVDGVIVDRATVMALDANAIEAVEVSRKDVPSMLITTKRVGDAADAPVRNELRRVVPLPLDEVEVPVRKPLLIVDGVLASELAIEQLDPARIENVEVVKGDAAKRLYGDRAANGVIQVTTWKDGARRPLLREQVKRPAGTPTVILRRDSTSRQP